MWPDQATTRLAAQPLRTVPPAPPRNPQRRFVQSGPKSVRGLSGVQHGQGFYFDGFQHREDFRRPATGGTAFYQALTRQSVVKQASGTTSNVRRCRPPAFTGTVWHLGSVAHDMLVPSHACLTCFSGSIKPNKSNRGSTPESSSLCQGRQRPLSAC